MGLRRAVPGAALLRLCGQTRTEFLVEVAGQVVLSPELVYVVELVLPSLCCGGVVATAWVLLLPVVELGNNHLGV